MPFSTAESTSRPAWPDPIEAHVPYALYTDPDVYTREQQRIFRGASWCYVALEAELAAPGSFLRTTIGEIPVVVTRDKHGDIHVVLNRCAHRGVMVCHEPHGTASTFTCPYHQWNYGLDGRLLGVPFKRGVGGQGGMPADFANADHGLERLRVTSRHGVVFATFHADTPPLAEYLGDTNLDWFDRVFDGRALRVLGYQRQTVPANWKLMFENIKDPYHASLLHVFLVTFGLFRADNPSSTKMDPTGRHSLLISERRPDAAADGPTSPTVDGPTVDGIDDITRIKTDLSLRDPRLLDPVREFAGSATVCMQTIWPNLIVQQQSNTLAMRQLVTRGPDRFELHWTYFGYADDDDAMQVRRLRQANLMGPAGLVSIDDSEVMRLAQIGAHAGQGRSALLEMGGHDRDDTTHMVTEAAIRAFYEHYRRVMDLDPGDVSVGGAV